MIEALLDALPVPAARLTAWLGPAIGAPRYEVGEDVADAIVACVGSEVAMNVLGRRTDAKNKWLADLSGFAALKLEARGVRSVVHSRSCTFDDRRFYSHRRDKSIGRIASRVPCVIRMCGRPRGSPGSMKPGEKASTCVTRSPFVRPSDSA